MLIEQIENEILIRIPNTLLNDKEVQSFLSFLEKIVPSKPTKKIRDQFEELYQEWQSETALLSSATAIVSNKAYLQMIKMGEVVIPFILLKLQKDPQHLFYALYEITGENPVPFIHAGNLEKMTNDWLQWGQEKRYIN